jgi:hypothetical protein
MKRATNQNTRGLQLADLIDLELQFLKDQQADRASLRKRDSRIGKELQANSIDGTDLYLAWLERVRGKANLSTGNRCVHFLNTLGSILFLFGLFLGGSAIAGWLLYDLSRPVNTLALWAAFVLTQLLLLALWLVLLLPPERAASIPGAQDLQLLLVDVARALPKAGEWLASRMSHDHRLLFQNVHAAYKRMDSLYGSIHRWTMIRLTQQFALAYNIGALALFVAVTYGADPAFGWKSRRLTPEQLTAATSVLSIPWRPAFREASPSHEDVVATQFTGLDPAFDPRRERAALGHDAWASWWPFMFGSLLVYAVFPRIITLFVSRRMIRHELASIKTTHRAFAEVRERLRSPYVTTAGTEPPPAIDSLPSEPDQITPLDPPLPDDTELLSHKSDQDSDETDQSPPQPADHPPDRGAFVIWAGIPMNDADAARKISERSGLAIDEGAIFRVGGPDIQDDEAAIKAIRLRKADEVIVLVEAWEPPVADYLDFLKRLRGAVGNEGMIQVMLFSQDGEGRPALPKKEHFDIWSQEINALGDAYIRTSEFIVEKGS